MNIKLGDNTVSLIFWKSADQLDQWVDRSKAVLVTDTNLYSLYADFFDRWKTIVLPAGEAYKQQATVDDLLKQLIHLEADRQTTLVGVGGGVVTDITGYAASVFMRGIPFGFLPTSLLAMVDAAIGGKNGVDVGPLKNLVGTIRQPAFIWYDRKWLDSLPLVEWQNGFAEIIKHAAIQNATLFEELEMRNVATYQEQTTQLETLIEANAKIKLNIVQQDPFEKGVRKWLNFGHTLGHAIENKIHIPHGFAIAIGMHYAARISAQKTGFTDTLRLVNLLKRYELPTEADFSIQEAVQMMRSDKKRSDDFINYVLLNKIGEATTMPIALSNLENMLAV